jgi:hypothetical protein
MGYLQRRSRRLLGLMQRLEWRNRCRLYVRYLDVTKPPRLLRGTGGVRWLFTGQVAKRRYGH